MLRKKHKKGSTVYETGDPQRWILEGILNIYSCTVGTREEIQLWKVDVQEGKKKLDILGHLE